MGENVFFALTVLPIAAANFGPRIAAGQGRDVKWLMYVMAVFLLVYFLAVRMQIQ